MAVEAICGGKTLSQLGSRFRVHAIPIAKWRKSALERLPELFVNGRTRPASTNQAETDARFEQIGCRRVELDWLKKGSACSTENIRQLVDREHTEISISRQCELLGVNLAGLYYRRRHRFTEVTE